jgi:hypothetical protein
VSENTAIVYNIKFVVLCVMTPCSFSADADYSEEYFAFIFRVVMYDYWKWPCVSRSSWSRAVSKTHDEILVFVKIVTALAAGGTLSEGETGLPIVQSHGQLCILTVFMYNLACVVES